MQEIVLILSSIAGVATAAAVRRVPRDKNRLLSLGASSHIKSQISSLKIEKEILTKTISRLYQTDSEFSKIQKDKLLLKYQHQLGIVLAKMEKLEQASSHPDLGPVGDGLITLMDQKLSKLDDKFYELSSKMTSRVDAPKGAEAKQETRSRPSKSFNFEKPKGKRPEPIEIPATKPRQSFEITTLTNISREKPRFTRFEDKAGQMPKPNDQIIEQMAQPKPKVDDKMEIVQSVMPKQKASLDAKPDLEEENAKITRYAALPEPPKAGPDAPEDHFDDDADDLDKIKSNIMKVLKKLDQAEVE